MGNFHPVDLIDNWGRWEYYLVGEYLAEDDILEVMWPDGRTDIVKIMSRGRNIPVYNHGREYEAYTTELFFRQIIHGYEVDIPLQTKGFRFRKD